MMIVQSRVVLMMPAVVVSRGGGRADLKLHMQRHARGQGERALAAAGRGQGVGAGRIHGCPADAAGDQAGRRGRVVR